MRLSDILSKEPMKEFIAVDNFAPKNSAQIGKSYKIEVGKVFLNQKCNNCNQVHQFYSDEILYFMPINADLLSIDCRLTCQYCGKTSVPVWFLIQVEGMSMTKGQKSVNILSTAKVRLLHRHFKYSSEVEPEPLKYKKEYSDLLIKADQAYYDQLGAGALVYLRKLYEMVTVDVAKDNGVAYQDRNGKTLNFRELLTRVNGQCSIIPQEFSANGYQLFSELSEIVHSSSTDEEVGMKKYTSLRRLIVGILDNIDDKRKKEELTAATRELSWSV
ncbi:hypothetical protein [Ruminococcus sp. RTP21204st1_B2_RTP21204_210225]